LLLRLVVDFADQANLTAVDLRFQRFLEVAPFSAREFRGDVKRPSSGTRYANGDLGAFIGVRRPRKAR
jgi:hypothetical protein